MRLRNLALTLAALLAFTNCAEDVEKLAAPYLLRANHAFEQKQYALAKLQIDSIKQLYPKAFETRVQAQKLLIEVELDEARTGKAYTDSLLTEAQAKVEPLAAALYLDKDARYQDIGFYYASRHRAEKNANKSYLRPQTNEHGAFTITAFYRGRATGAQALRFTAPDDSFIELKPTAEPYIMSDATGRTERTDFAATPDLAHFVTMHPTIKVTLAGSERKAQMPFAKTDAQALIQVAELASTLQAVSALQAEQQELMRRITFYEQRQAHQPTQARD